MIFKQTRGSDGQSAEEVRFSDAILSPVASFGGIYSPAELPEIDSNFLAAHLSASYKSLALSIINRLEVDIDQQTLVAALELYDKFDDAKNPVPVVKLTNDTYVSELYHGPTRAFKDIALQPFGLILSSLAKERQKQYLILAATSGDTGPAALETFRDRDNIRMVCIYPAGGTSEVQRLQMVTESAPNLKVIGIEGNFDDAQSALKSLLASPTFNQQLEDLGISLSAANSVNFGRILFQIIYHIHSYLELVRQKAIGLGDKVYLTIPSGNFGNALGAYYARKMGLPVERIIVASNANNVLSEWINTGRYDISNKTLVLTSSPAMDILKSSNVERILFDLFGATRTAALMRELDDNQCYQLSAEETAQIQSIFASDSSSDDEGIARIQQTFKGGYLLDPHTATCFKACQTRAHKPLVKLIFSTAEWTKFSPLIDFALTGNSAASDQQALASIAIAARIAIPEGIAALFDKPVRHDLVINKNQIEAEIIAFLQTGK